MYHKSTITSFVSFQRLSLEPLSLNEHLCPTLLYFELTYQQDKDQSYLVGCYHDAELLFWHQLALQCVQIQMKYIRLQQKLSLMASSSMN